jgi:hypothetical protein
VGHDCGSGTRLLGKTLGQDCGTRMWDKTVGQECGTRLWDKTVGQGHKTANFSKIGLDSLGDEFTGSLCVKRIPRPYHGNNVETNFG